MPIGRHQRRVINTDEAKQLSESTGRKVTKYPRAFGGEERKLPRQLKLSRKSWNDQFARVVSLSKP